MEKKKPSSDETIYPRSVSGYIPHSHYGEEDDLYDESVKTVGDKKDGNLHKPVKTDRVEEDDDPYGPGESDEDEIEEIECEKCGTSLQLVNPRSNRCPNCGLKYDRDGDIITEDAECLECGATVYLINRKENECEACGLKYDGNGEPVASKPPPGKYIGDQEVGGVGTSSTESYYVDCTDDGTWIVFHHGAHPGLLAVEGPYDAEELLEALEELGFEREEIIEKRIKGLKAALKKKRPPSSGT